MFPQVQDRIIFTEQFVPSSNINNILNMNIGRQILLHPVLLVNDKSGVFYTLSMRLKQLALFIFVSTTNGCTSLAPGLKNFQIKDFGRRNEYQK